jgi:iron complex transport system ATP-binding protein
MLDTTALQLMAGRRTLVEGLDWHVAAGQCWCIIGQNGAGKSTLLRTLAGLATPHAGTVAIDGKALADWSLSALARQRAFLPQSRTDAFGYRVLDTVLAARQPYHDGRYWEGSADHIAARKALAALDVAALAERDIRSLSGGERQRVAIAALLAQDTPLMLLDEPANALDLGHQVAVMDLLARLCRSDGRTVVMVSHDLNLAQGSASHALLLMPGGAWQAGPVAAMLQPELLAQCLGHPIELVAHRGSTIFVPVRR